MKGQISQRVQPEYKEMHFVFTKNHYILSNHLRATFNRIRALLKSQTQTVNITNKYLKTIFLFGTEQLIKSLHSFAGKDCDPFLVI